MELAADAASRAWEMAVGLSADAGPSLAKTGAVQTVIQGNRVTAGRLQLRLGRDRRWNPYARSDDDWEPSGAPEIDPARALESL